MSYTLSSTTIQQSSLWLCSATCSSVYTGHGRRGIRRSSQPGGGSKVLTTTGVGAVRHCCSGGLGGPRAPSRQGRRCGPDVPRFSPAQTQHGFSGLSGLPLYILIPPDHLITFCRPFDFTPVLSRLRASRVAGWPSRHLVAQRPANSYGIFGTPRRAPREHSDKPDR